MLYRILHLYSPIFFRLLKLLLSDLICRRKDAYPVSTLHFWVYLFYLVNYFHTPA
jgi:hypothetical protein